jgi:hypothetical protein
MDGAVTNIVVVTASNVGSGVPVGIACRFIPLRG